MEGFYVSVQHHDRRGLLLGPFGTRDAAERFVSTGSRLAEDVDQDAGWYLYGTARVVPRPGRELPQGRLNDRFAAMVAAGQPALALF